jgi:hypothetical protein
VPVAPTLSLQKDTGSSDHDLVSSSGVVNVSGLEAGATLAISLDGGQTWRSRSGDALPESLFGADGAKHLLVKQIDVNGNPGTVAELSFQLDRTAPDALRWAMPDGKPVLGASDVMALQGVEAGALVEYRVDASAPWLTATGGQIPVSQFHKDGTQYIEVRQTDLAGNVSPATTLVAAVDVTAPAALTLSLATDTGASHVDLITSSGVVNVSGLEAGASLSISLDGGQTWRSSSGNVLPESLLGADGAKHLQVKQIDASGNESAVADLSFQLDRTAPDALRWAMPAGKPALGASDVIALQGVEAGALVEYRLDASAPWLAATDGQIPVSLFHKDGTEHFEVRQTDLAGNVGLATSLVAAVDVTAPEIPVITLLGSSVKNAAGLSVSANPNLKVSGLEQGSDRFYSLDQGLTWNAFSGDTLPTSIFGKDSRGHEDQNVQVKQVDNAGNAAVSQSLNFVFDNFTPKLSWTSPFQIGPEGGAVYGPNGIPLKKPVLGREDSIGVFGFENEAHQQFSLDGGAHWTAFSPSQTLVRDLFDGQSDGKYTLMLRQTDLVGNVSTSSGEISVDVHAPVKPELRLKNDDGPSATDRVTSDGAIVVSGLEPGVKVQFSVLSVRGHDIAGWQDAGTMSGKELIIDPYANSGFSGNVEIAVRLVDTAGNVSLSNSLSFTMAHPPL